MTFTVAYITLNKYFTKKKKTIIFENWDLLTDFLIKLSNLYRKIVTKKKIKFRFFFFFVNCI